MERTVCIAYFNHRHQRLKIPNDRLGSNPNTAVMRAHWHMVANTYGAHYVQVYDVTTAELYAEYAQKFVKGERQVITTSDYNVRKFGDPIRRVSAHALFHDLPLAEPDK